MSGGFGLRRSQGRGGSSSEGSPTTRRVSPVTLYRVSTPSHDPWDSPQGRTGSVPISRRTRLGTHVARPDHLPPTGSSCPGSGRGVSFRPSSSCPTDSVGVPSRDGRPRRHRRPRQQPVVSGRVDHLQLPHHPRLGLSGRDSGGVEPERRRGPESVSQGVGGTSGPPLFVRQRTLVAPRVGPAPPESRVSSLSQCLWEPAPKDLLCVPRRRSTLTDGVARPEEEW